MGIPHGWGYSAYWRESSGALSRFDGVKPGFAGPSYTSSESQPGLWDRFVTTFIFDGDACAGGMSPGCGIELAGLIGPGKLLKGSKWLRNFFRFSDEATDAGHIATNTLDDVVRGADELLVPGGTRIGTAGSRASIREVTGGLDDAQALFTDLSRGGTVVTDTTYPGTLVRLPDGGTVGLRTTMTNSPGSIANIDVNIPGIGITKIKFIP